MKNSSAKSKHDVAARALAIASLVSLILAATKLVAFVFSGSLLVLTSFFDSLSDATISYVNRWVQKISRLAPDREHPFGHGGYQVISGLAQGIVISLFGVYLVIESSLRIRDLSDADPVDFANLPMAVGVLLFSAICGLGLDQYLAVKLADLKRSASRSLALLADRAHYNGDAKMNAASAVGLIAVWYTKLDILDALFGYVGAYFMFRAAAPILWHTYRDIVHSEASPELQAQIVALAKGADTRIQSVHRLRTRELGPLLFVDFHMTLPSQITLETAHDISESATRAIRAAIPRADVMIHLDPDSEPDDDFWEPHPTGQ